MTKTMSTSPDNPARKAVPDMVTYGTGDLFKLISKASSEKEGWMKSTKAMRVGHGWLVQVTTQQRNPDGSYALAEALTFVPSLIKTSDDGELCANDWLLDGNAP